MIHPEYEVILSDHTLKDEKLTPVYRVPKGIGQKKIRGFIHAAISKLDFAEDFLDVEKYDSSLNMNQYLNEAPLKSLSGYPCNLKSSGTMEKQPISDKSTFIIKFKSLFSTAFINISVCI